jgi:transcriptional regulator with XRE-family HTH domain
MPERQATDPTTVRFGQRLRELRQATGQSQLNWAAEHGFDRTFVGYLETGRRSPTVATLARLAKAHGLTISELVEGIDEP